MATRKYHRKSKKSNKRFRKTRSKRQRGGNQEEEIEEINKFFFDAIVMDEADKVKNALDAKADVNMTDRLRIGLKVGNTALIEACTYKYKEIVEMLLKQDGIEVNATNDNGDTALMKAIHCNEEVDYDRWTNVENDIIAIVEMLLAAGADVNVKNKNGETALAIAIKSECTEEIQSPLKQLIQRNKEKQTLMNIAIEQGIKRPTTKKEAKTQKVLGQAVREKDQYDNKKVVDLTGPTSLIKSYLGGKRKTKRKTKKH
jgi:hypothetical protein